MNNRLFERFNYKCKIFLLILLVVFFICQYSIYKYTPIEEEFYKLGEPGGLLSIDFKSPTKYLINTPTCKIPDIDPFSADIADYYHKLEYIPCRKLELLTYIEKQNGSVILHVNTSLLRHYSSYKITCCYSKIIRNDKTDPDFVITYSPCSVFEEYTIVTYPYIKVTCSDPGREVYANVHAVTMSTRKELEVSGDKDDVFSVLLIGIDSISKLNLKRTMPKTYKYLEKNFVSLRGYNKIADNTYPNVMAILTGQNLRQVKKRCGSGPTLKLKQCGFIWEEFRNLGYATILAEDACSLGIFNYATPGFMDPPTDYYYRPYMLAAEKLPTEDVTNKYFCSGPETSGERTLNIIKDVAVNLINVPKFGFFWMNSFSHEDMNAPSMMDEKILEFLNDTSFKSSLEKTIMIFFSDHGFRFGSMRYTHTGWLEERLPMMYFYIPDSFKENFPEKYYSFLLNTLRLTTPYDVHNTLQDVLKLKHNTYIGKKSLGCSKCQSLFKVIDELRTCKDAAIRQHWCTCTGHTYINPKSQTAQAVANFVVNKVNSIIRYFADGGKCFQYNLDFVYSAGASELYLNEKNKTVRYIVVIAITHLDAAFEATIETQLISGRNYYKLLGDISRLDIYAENSYCVKENIILEKYCYCKRRYR